MPFLGIFTGLLKLFWPFIKESLLKDGTLKDFISKNRTTCVWLTMMLVMLLGQGYLFYEAHSARADLQRFAVQMNQLNMNHTLLRQQYTMLETDRNAYRDRAKDLEAKYAELETSHGELSANNERYERWLRACGVDLQFEGNVPPQCRARPAARPKPKPRPVAPPTITQIPETKPEPAKPTAWERLKGIFSRKNKDSE